MYFLDSTWESKEIKSNTTIPVVGAAADFKYLIRVPKQETENENGENSDYQESVNKRRNDKYYKAFDNDSDEDSDDECDDEEEIVILRCQTSICQDGDKCVPMEFDFVVRVRFGDDNDAPQAADTYFPYTLPYDPSKSNSLSNASTKINSASANKLDSSKELINTTSGSNKPIN